MDKISIIIGLAFLYACSGSEPLPRETHFKSRAGIGCDTEQLSRDITLDIKRGLIEKAQRQIDASIASGACVQYGGNELIILTGYSKGYYQFHIKGTDDMPKRSFYVSGELVN